MSAISPEQRQAVGARASARCEYCRLPQASQVATFPVDHVVPRSAGGKTELWNLAMACPRCNALKWTHIVGTDPESGEQIELFNPRRDAWEEHFQWSEETPERLLAHTAIARATIALLELNAPRRLEIRRWLAEIGVHPPA